MDLFKIIYFSNKNKWNDILWWSYERINSYDSNALSLGGLRLFSSNKSDFILSSPSSYFNNYNTSLSMTVSFNNITAKSNNGIENKLKSNNYNHFSFGFPITENQYFLLSLNPVFRYPIVIDIFIR